MRVKIFQANGAKDIAELENDINGWLGLLAPGTQVQTNTALCTISDGGDAEAYQSIVVTVWYGP